MTGLQSSTAAAARPKIKAGFAEDSAEAQLDLPLWPEAASKKMKIDVTVNKDSKVWVLHDRPFPDLLEWIEFDAETGLMSFITAKGKIQELGMIIHRPMSEYVAEARDACVVMIRDGAIRDMGLVPLTVQQFDLIKGERK